jgi:hypothetical protein
MIKSRKVRWAGYVAWGKMNIHTKKGRDHSEDIGADERIILIDWKGILFGVH